MPIDVSRSLFIKNDAGEFVPVPMLKGEPGPKGDPGDPGAPGRDGSDASVTAANITAALGFSPADAAELETKADVSKLAETADKLDALWKLSEGQVYDYVQQEEQGMNAAPKGTFAQYVDGVRGESRQETTNGYQLINWDGATVRTMRGVTPTINPDGSISFRGVVTESGFNGVIELQSNIQLDGNITFSIDRELPFHVVFVNDNWGSPARIFTGETSRTIEFSSVSNCRRIALMDIPVGTEVDLTFFTMIERGSVAHPWEKYTGGIPMPNPDYPSEIHSVERVDVKVTGRNLIDAKAENLIQFVDHAGTNRWGFEAMLPAGTYSIRAYVESAFAWHIDTNTRPLVNNRDVTFTLTQTKLMHVYTSATGVKANVVNDLLTTTIQLERGTTVTPYEPYHERTCTLNPPTPLNRIGEYADKVDIDEGVWEYRTKKYQIENVKVVFNEIGNNAQLLTGDVWDVDTFVSRNIPAYLEKGTLKNNNLRARMTTVADKGWSGQSRIIFTNYTFSTRQEMENAILGTNAVVPIPTPQTEPIAEADLTVLRSLSELPADAVVTMLDQDGNDVSYLMTYMRKLSEVN